MRGHWWLGMGDEERKERRKEVGRGEGEQRRDEGKRCGERDLGKSEGCVGPLQFAAQRPLALIYDGELRSRWALDVRHVGTSDRGGPCGRER